MTDAHKKYSENLTELSKVEAASAAKNGLNVLKNLMKQSGDNPDVFLKLFRASKKPLSMLLSAHGAGSMKKARVLGSQFAKEKLNAV